MKLTPTFQSWDCTGQRVFLRADLNVPLADGSIANDRRLQAVLPTLDLLLKKEAQIVLASHLGRPKGKEDHLSTQQLMGWFEKRGYTIHFAPTPAHAQESSLEPGSIILLENLRFFPGEKSKNELFIQALFDLADWYVLDAFGTLHRSESSLAPLADKYPENHRSIGLLVEKELSVLQKLQHNPTEPTCFILGGGKVEDKLPLIEHLLPIATTIVLCPAIVFTFLKALGKPVGKSLVDESALDTARTIVDKVKKAETELIFPVDYQVAHGSKDGALSYHDAADFPNDGVGLSIGPKGIAQIEAIIQKSHTIFYNGMMGLTDRKETLEGVKAIIAALSQSSATTIVAGGNSIDIIDKMGLTGITYPMTGGGSTITYLAGKPLPALQPFLKNGTKANEV